MIALKFLHLAHLSLFMTIFFITSCSNDNESTSIAAESTEEVLYADLIITGAKVYTVNPQQPWAEAIAVKQGKILAVGSESDVNEFKGNDTQLMTLTEGMVMPGFHDAHTHVIYGGLEMNECALHEFESIEAILEKVKLCADASTNGWVVGAGWLISLFQPEGKPDKKLLDEIVPDIPVYLNGVDGHNGWANSLALKLAGIDKDTVNPEGGIIERDPVTGEAVGTLRETAMNLVKSVAPGKSHKNYLDAGRYALNFHNSLGITSIIDASVGEAELAAYAELDKNNELSARLITSIEYGTNLVAHTDDFDSLTEKWKNYEGKRLRTRSIKLLIDGVLEGETAALLEPYIGPRQHHGLLNFDQNRLTEIITKFDADDFQIHMHAIGDAAVRAALDALEVARSENGIKDNRHHISHLQLIHPDDIPRFSQLKVTANFQAFWALADNYITKLNLPLVGQDRVDRMYPIASMQKSGARIVGGSDWTVSSLNPLQAIQIGMTREDKDGQVTGEKSEVLNAEERVDLKTMIEAYTINGAWIMHQEDITGSIEVGKYADLIILDKNIFEIAPNEIHKARVLQTFLEGKRIYSAE